MTDDRPPCADCRHSTLWRPDWLRTSPHALLCRHPSALRINEGSPWVATAARERCNGRRWEKR